MLKAEIQTERASAESGDLIIASLSALPLDNVALPRNEGQFNRTALEEDLLVRNGIIEIRMCQVSDGRWTLAYRVRVSRISVPAMAHRPINNLSY
jgi:hypothetical protein